MFFYYDRLVLARSDVTTRDLLLDAGFVEDIAVTNFT